MSVHGYCFDMGMSGKCGIECEKLREGECDSATSKDFQVDEIFEYIEDFDEYVLFSDGRFDDYLGNIILGEFMMNVIKIQTSTNMTIRSELEKIFK